MTSRTESRTSTGAHRVTGMPCISVVIPVTDSGHPLAKLFAALDVQQGVDTQLMEVIVVVRDTPGTAERIRALRPECRPRLLEIIHSGTGGARDAGWRAAEAPLVLFLDEDVVPSPALVAEHLQAHRDHGPCIVLGHLEPPGGRRAPWFAYDDRVLAKKHARLVSEEIPSGIHYGGNVSLTRQLLEAVGGHDRVLPEDADVELGDRLRRQGARFVYHPAALAVRHGRGDYRAWRRRHSLHGRVDVALRRDRGLSGGLPGLLACYHDRHPLNRLAIRLGLGRRTEESGGLTDLLAAVGKLTYRLRLDGISFAAFSGAANILYWSGVRDGLRGSAAFWKGVRSVRHLGDRPYLAAERSVRK